MRIISGIARGRTLVSPRAKQGKGLIRPTTDRAREALFNIIGPQKIQDALVLDLFAGTGALGLEALSRGADSAVFIDKHQPALKIVCQNAERCSFVESCHILKRDLSKGLRFLKSFVKKVTRHSDGQETAFDLVFLDPPYEKFKAEFFLDQLQKYQLIGPHSLVLFEDRSSAVLPERVADLVLCDQRKYGDTGGWFYSYNNVPNFKMGLK